MENGNNTNTLILEKKAVKAALSQNWKLSVKINLELLEVEPNNKKAKMRLGRAYLQTTEFKKAEKIFKEVLKIDPISSIAQKNLNLAKAKKKDKAHIQPKNKELIKEPGMSEMIIMELSAKNLSAADFELRETLELKINKSSVNVTKKGKLIGKITLPDLVARLNAAKKKRAAIESSFYSGHKNVIKIILKSDISVFKAEKQELKPYMKKGTIDEPAVEMETTENKK